MRFLFLLTLLGAGLSAASACQTVAGDRILGRDLAALNPVFASLPPDLPVSFTPLAGVERILRSDELVRIAKAHHITLPGPLSPVCFERPTETLTPEKLLPVLRKSLAIENATLEILDFAHYGVPVGVIEFSRASLTASGMWRGHIRYGQGFTAPVWVKVRITAPQKWVEARVRLEPGKPVDASELLVKMGPLSPLEAAPVDSLDLVAGKKPLRTIEPGVPLLKSWFTAVREVEHGDVVMVEVASGDAALVFDGIAQSAGRAGEKILVKNPQSGRVFQARVEAKGRVFVKAEKDIRGETEDQ